MVCFSQSLPPKRPVWLNMDMMTDWRSRIEAVVDRELPDSETLSRPGQVGDARIDGGAPSEEEWAVAGELRLAAVLVPVVEHDSGPSILLTRRADHLDKHSGQVAFPGGKVEKRDASPVEAALREAEEEIGLKSDFVEVAGFLDTYQTGTGFLMLPVVSFIQPGFTLTPDENEVADIFEVPLHQALNVENYERHQVMWKGKQRTYYSMQYEGYNIWGATAGVLMHMSRRVTS